jgi:hypothetical protein
MMISLGEKATMINIRRMLLYSVHINRSEKTR